jgi:hypothetical protein
LIRIRSFLGANQKSKARLQYRNVFDVLAKKQRPQGWESSTFEGGLRVPFVVSGPGIKPGSQCDVPVLKLFNVATDYAEQQKLA